MKCYVAGIEFSSENSLAHHGIKGQKWGVRRFQNPDGTYTQAGKMRYSKSYGPILNYQNNEGLLTNKGKKKYGELLELNEETKKSRDAYLESVRKYDSEVKKLMKNKKIMNEEADYYARNIVGIEDEDELKDYKEFMLSDPYEKRFLVSEYTRNNPFSKVASLMFENERRYDTYSKNRDKMAEHILNSMNMDKFPSKIREGTNEWNVFTKGRSTYYDRLRNLQFETDLYFHSQTAFAKDSGNKERLKELRYEKKKIFS